MAKKIEQDIPAYFLDIETVRIVNQYSELSHKMMSLFEKRFIRDIDEYCERNGNDLETSAWKVFLQDLWEKKAGMYAEFGKIVCISLGKIIYAKDAPVTLRIKAVYGMNEKIILDEFKSMIIKAQILCAHNGKEFDFPWLQRRMIINDVDVPWQIDPLAEIGTKKPWDLKLEDTKEMWSGVQWKHSTSLDLLAAIFGIISSKTIMDGSMVGNFYYDAISKIDPNKLPFEEQARVLKPLGNYCNADIYVLANIYLKLKGYEMIKPENVVYA